MNSAHPEDRRQANIRWAQVVEAVIRALVVGIIILGGLSSIGVLDRTVDLAPSHVNAHSGKAFIVSVAAVDPERAWTPLLYNRRGDSNAMPLASVLQVFEDGQPLSHPHCTHVSVIQDGNGCFSHWGDSLLFSSSDNTDPRSNRRSYRLVWPADAGPPLTVLVALAVVLALTRRAVGPVNMVPEIRVLRAAGQRLGLVFSARVVFRIALVLFAGLAILQHTGSLDRQSTITASAINPLRGHAYSFELAEAGFARGFDWIAFDSRPDTNGDPTRSSMRLLEDGRLLRAHTAHADIADGGGARYSHWGDQILFATYDNSDPRRNGRRYVLAQRPDLGRLLLIPAMLAAVVLIWTRQAGRVNEVPELAAATQYARSAPFWFAASLGVSGYLIITHAVGGPPIPLLQSDSVSYWTISDLVPLGYPAFIHAVHFLFGSWKAIVMAQLVLFCVATLILQCGLQAVTRSATTAGLTSLGVLLGGGLLSTVNFLLSESLFISILLLHTAAAAWCFARPRRLALLALAITTVLALFVRPAGYFVLGGLFALALGWRGARTQVVIWTLVPSVVLIGVTFALGQAVRGVPAQSIGGLALFPHVVHLYQPGFLKNVSDSEEQVIAKAANPYKLERSMALNWIEAQQIEANNFNRISHDIQRGIFEKTGIKSLPYFNEIFMKASLDLIKRDPGGYAETVLQNMYGGFVQFALASVNEYGPTLRENYLRFLDEVESGLYRQVLEVKPRPSAEPLDRYILLSDHPALPRIRLSSNQRALLLLTFIVVALSAGLQLMVAAKASPQAALVAYVAVLAGGGYLLVSLSTVFISRYAVPLDALIITATLVGAHRLASGIRCLACRMFLGTRESDPSAEVDPVRRGGALRVLTRRTVFYPHLFPSETLIAHLPPERPPSRSWKSTVPGWPNLRRRSPAR